jgi:hypothetical protein
VNVSIVKQSILGSQTTRLNVKHLNQTLIRIMPRVQPIIQKFEIPLLLRLEIQSNISRNDLKIFETRQHRTNQPVLNFRISNGLKHQNPPVLPHSAHLPLFRCRLILSCSIGPQLPATMRQEASTTSTMVATSIRRAKRFQPPFQVPCSTSDTHTHTHTHTRTAHTRASSAADVHTANNGRGLRRRPHTSDAYSDPGD